jgi:acetate kinase
MLKELHMEHHILCINSGSSSMKVAMYPFDTTEKLIAEDEVERIGLSGDWLWLKDGQGKCLVDRHLDISDHKEGNEE